MPRQRDLDWSGLDNVVRARYADLMAVEREAWALELLQHEELFMKLYDRLPRELALKRELLLAGLARSPERWTATS
jgi:phosphoenolpyruvate carboxykinase (GTP)